MVGLSTFNLSAAQLDRIERYDIDECVDVHCHVLPGLDDGPESDAAALALCRALVDDGITAVIATPHQLGIYMGVNAAGDVRRACDHLRRLVIEDGLRLHVLPGADVRVDECVPDLIAAGDVLTLANRGRHVLLELPHETFIDPVPLIRRLKLRGISAIMSHPERHSAIARRPQLAYGWIEAGAVLQVTAGSLLGQFGATAEATAWALLDAGLVAVVASDAHDVSRRPPSITDAMDALDDELGPERTRLLCVDNPRAIWFGRTLRPISPVPSARRVIGGATW